MSDTDFFDQPAERDADDEDSAESAVETAKPKSSAAPALGALRPLADRLRPTSFDDYMGQEKILGEGAPLRQLIAGERIPSMILWGPPGSGKTTLASLIARATSSDFIALSAVTSSLKDVRQVVGHAKVNRQYARRTILFVDEIHRFNKSQQDAFLPHVESGLVTLIGATTENPSFSVISALLSRCRVYALEPLREEHLARLLARGMALLNADVPDKEPLALDDDATAAIARLCDGDGRRALGILEVAVHVARHRGVALTRELVLETSQRQLMYDRAGEEHFNLMSALHKTIRSSDPHAAIYWCTRILEGGEDPRYVLRRLIRIAAEDVGLADPNAVQQAVACMEAYEKLGPPEGNLFAVQLATYLAMAPKSDAVYAASRKARSLVAETGTLPVPMHLRNAPTGLMKAAGYGKGYEYDHDAPEHFAPKQGLPDDLDDGRRLYEPTEQGIEKRIRERLDRFDAARDEERARRKRAEDPT